MDGDVPASPGTFGSSTGRFLAITTIVVAAIIGAFLLGWIFQPHRVTATALFDVGRTDSSVMSSVYERGLNQTDFEIVKKTQLALLKSNFVLNAALRNPKIAGSPLLSSQSDPVEWLQDHLEISFPEDGQILSIKLAGTESQSADLVPIVDAVANAYRNEVLIGQRQQRLEKRDVLARNLENTNTEVKRRLDEYLAIAREAGRAEGASGTVMQQLSAKRLERIEDEILRLESQLAIEAKGDDAKRKAIHERIHQLQDQLSTLAKGLASSVERSADLEFREQEIKQLQSLTSEMAVKLEQLDLDANGPDRIQQVQTAAIARE